MKWIINILIYITIYHNFFVKLFVSKSLTEKNIKYILQNENFISKNFLYIIDNKLEFKYFNISMKFSQFYYKNKNALIIKIN